MTEPARPRRLSLWLLLALANPVSAAALLGASLSGLASLGCASSQPEPEWPERPLPAYPSADQEVAARQSAAADSRRADSTPPDSSAASAAPGTSSQLAKEYAGRATLEEHRGEASYYADSLAGNHTASGDIYDPRKHTAAHRKLAFGTVVRVTRTDTGAVTYVTINDRGPFGSSERIIDLSRAAAEDLAMMKAGVVSVLVEVLDKAK